jgi:hypothetical protein
MKLIFTIIAFLLFNFSIGQIKNGTKIKLNLFVPAFSKSAIKSTEKLTIYLLSFPDDSLRNIPKKIVATRLKDNSFEFILPNYNFWKISFGIANFSKDLMCIENKNGDAFEENSLSLNLEETKYKEKEFLPPCMRQD